MAIYLDLGRRGTAAMIASNPPPGTVPASIFVHLMSGEVDQLTPADSVLVGSETVSVYDHGQQVAQYTAREVLFCSHLDVPPFPID
jgi:hypothetical protein